MDCWKHSTEQSGRRVHDSFEVWPDASGEGVCAAGWTVESRTPKPPFFHGGLSLPPSFVGHWNVQASGGNVGSEEHPGRCGQGATYERGNRFGTERKSSRAAAGFCMQVGRSCSAWPSFVKSLWRQICAVLDAVPRMPLPGCWSPDHDILHLQLLSDALAGG